MQTLTQCITLSTSLMEICKFIRLSHSAATWILGARGESYIRFDQPSNFQLPTVHQSILKSVKVSENSDMKYIHLLCVRFMDFFVGCPPAQLRILS